MGMDSSFIIKYLHLSSLSWEHTPLRKNHFGLWYTISDRICHLIGRYYYLGLLHWPGTYLATNQPSGAPHLIETDRKISLNTRKKKHFYCESHQTLSQVTCRSYRVSILGDVQNLTGYGLEQPLLAYPVLSRCVALVDFCDLRYVVSPWAVSSSCLAPWEEGPFSPAPTRVHITVHRRPW